MNKSLKPTTYRKHGFTLVELVTIIVILGIIAAIAAPRFFGRADFDNRGFYDQVISTLRYAQKAAIAQRRFVCVTFPAANQITLMWGATNNCAGPVVSPSGDTYPLTSRNNASFSPTPAAFSFDCLGRPRDTVTPATCGDTAGILLTATPIRISGYATPIIVERETGYVH